VIYVIISTILSIVYLLARRIFSELYKTTEDVSADRYSLLRSLIALVILLLGVFSLVSLWLHLNNFFDRDIYYICVALSVSMIIGLTILALIVERIFYLMGKD